MIMRFAIAGTLILGACAPTVAPVAPSARVIPSGPEPERLEAGFNRAAIERDLLITARARFGEPLVRRALSSTAYIFAKYYPGMMPPPPPDAGPGWRYPQFPMTLLFHENGQWLAATREGIRPAKATAIGEIRNLLADPAFWRQPDYAPPGCTDAGASLLMLRIPGRPEIIRRGTCGDTELTQRLVSLARDA